MSNLFWLTDAQMAGLEPFFPKSTRRTENSPGGLLNKSEWSDSPFAPRDCLGAGIVSGDVVHMEATLIRADVSLGSLVAQHLDVGDLANLDEDDRLSRQTASSRSTA